MKTLNDLFELINQVILNEATKSYVIKAKVNFSITPYFDEKSNYEKTLISFNYSLETGGTKDNKVSILANFNEDKTELIQHYYWLIKTQCRF